MSHMKSSELFHQGETVDTVRLKPKPQLEFLEDESDVLVFGVNPKSGVTLQDSFLKYKAQRQVSH